jgi:hypothetical protein
VEVTDGCDRFMAVLLLLRKSATNGRGNAEGREDARCEPSSIDLFWSCAAGEFIACVDVASSVGESFRRNPVRSDLTRSDRGARAIAQMISQHDQAIGAEEWQRTQKYAMYEGEYGSSATYPQTQGENDGECQPRCFPQLAICKAEIVCKCVHGSGRSSQR